MTNGDFSEVNFINYAWIVVSKVVNDISKCHLQPKNSRILNSRLSLFIATLVTDN